MTARQIMNESIERKTRERTTLAHISTKARQSVVLAEETLDARGVLPAATMGNKIFTTERKPKMKNTQDTEATTRLLGVIAEIHEAAQQAQEKNCVIDDSELTLNKFVRQGDIYIQRIDKLPEGLVPWGSNKIADGETIGSRHMVSGCQVWRRSDHDRMDNVIVKVDGEDVPCTRYIGPCIEADGRWDNTHPEHWRYDNPPGYFQTYYQADFAAQRKVAD